VVYFPTQLYSIIIGRDFFPNATVDYYYWTWFFSQRDCRLFLLDVFFFQTQLYSIIIIGRGFFPNASVDYYYWTGFFSQRDCRLLLLDVIFFPTRL